MINDKEKLWYGTILTATTVLSIYSLLMMENHIPAIQQNLLDSQETIASLQEHSAKQNDMLQALQTDLKSVYQNLAEKSNAEKQILATKSVCHGLQGVTDAESLRQQGKLQEATATLNETKELFWKAGDVLTTEQATLRNLMAPIDGLMDKWNKGDKSAEADKLSADVKTIIKKVDKYAELCAVSGKANSNLTEARAPALPANKQQNTGVTTLCRGYQQMTEAENRKQNDPSVASETLSAAKESIWKASEVLTQEQKSLRGLMSPLDILIAQWKNGDKTSRSSEIITTVKSILQSVGTTPEACASLAEEHNPQPLSDADYQDQSAPAPIPITSNFSAPTSIIVTYAQPQQLKSEMPWAMQPEKTPKKSDTGCEKPSTEACSFSSFPGDYTIQGSTHCLWKSLEKINHAESKRREGDMQSAVTLIKAAKQLIWRTGDILISEQNELGLLMKPIDTVTTDWVKGDKKAEVSKIVAQLTKILHRLDKKHS